MPIMHSVRSIGSGIIILPIKFFARLNSISAPTSELTEQALYPPHAFGANPLCFSNAKCVKYASIHIDTFAYPFALVTRRDGSNEFYLLTLEPILSVTSLETAWYKSPSWSLLLLPLAWLFAVITAARRMAYRLGWLKQTTPSIPVIVVGNINVGGTGKTPFVVWLVEYLTEKGFTPGVIARGYGGSHSKHHKSSMLLSAKSTAAQVGDEPLLVFQRCGCRVAVGRNRIESAELLQQSGCDIIISDDGLQHYALGRHIETIIVDGARGFGNSQLMPAGPLREMPKRIRDADIVVINQGTESQATNQSNRERYNELSQLLAGAADTTLGTYCIETLPLKSVKTQQAADVTHLTDVQLVCGIGNPERFQQAIARHGINAEAITVFSDHHPFTAQDFQKFAHQTIIMTEKDAVKCREFAESNWYYLPISAEVSPQIPKAIEKALAACQ